MSDKTDTVLVIDSDAHLLLPVSPEFLQAVSGGNFQFVERDDRIELIEFTGRCFLQLDRQPLAGLFTLDAVEYIRGRLVCK